MTLRSHPSTVDLDDESLVSLAQHDDEVALEILVRRYRGYARAKSRTYFLVGADAEDLEQEGLIGLYKAVRDFRAERGVAFRAFADLCVSRQVITAIKSANRHKHSALNQYVSLTGTRAGSEDGSERCLEDVLEGSATDPAEELVGRERVADINRTLAATLSDFEVEVLQLYVEGISYQDIGARLGRHAKAIDNAIQRIKRKLGSYLEASEELSLAA